MTQPRILVVDDERIVSMDIQDALTRLGYSVAGLAASGEAALDMAARERPDLVLMDIRLGGGMGGDEAAMRMTRDFSVPVIFLTAYSDEDTMRRALAASPFGYLLKPFDDRELRNTIELALTKHAAEAEMRRARRVAEEADRAKTAFLATLSHELRTPMNGILGMAELLLLSNLDADQRETARHLRRAATSFIDILNKLLEFSTLEAGSCELANREFAPAVFLREAVAVHRRLAEAKGLAFRIDIKDLPERLCGAPERVAQLLGHLLDNAVANTATGSISVEALEDPGAPPAQELSCGGGAGAEPFRLLLRVRDTGCGIPADRLPQLFESFTQGEDYLTRRTGGLGLGLAMSQRLAERLGGVLGAESTPGEGSVFYARLPLRRCLVGGDPSHLSGVRVLVVEDNQVNRLFVAKTLAREGCSVIEASGGAEAARRLGENAVDLVLMDLQLGDMDGITLTRRIRSGEFCPDADIPVVALTAHVQRGTRELCRAAGLDEVLSKPISAAELTQALRSVLARSRSRGAQTFNNGAGTTQ
jgi:CheY-like chemotaxis protein